MFAGFCFNCVFVENITMKRILLIMVLINLCVNVGNKQRTIQ